MATVRLDQRGWEDGDLPDVCMLCGGHAPNRVKKTFVHQQPWVISLQARRVALVPMCREHRNHWWKRSLLAYGPFLSALVLDFMLVRAVDDMDPDSPIAIASYAFGLFALMASLVVGIVIQWRTIRATEISERSLILVNVSPKFVEAYEKFLDEEVSRQQMVRLGRDARQRWNDPPTRRDDCPDKNDNIRPG